MEVVEGNEARTSKWLWVECVDERAQLYMGLWTVLVCVRIVWWYQYIRFLTFSPVSGRGKRALPAHVMEFNGTVIMEIDASYACKWSALNANTFAKTRTGSKRASVLVLGNQHGLHCQHRILV